MSEGVEAELERLEEEMERRVEEGKRKMAEIDEKRKVSFPLRWRIVC